MSMSLAAIQSAPRAQGATHRSAPAPPIHPAPLRASSRTPRHHRRAYRAAAAGTAGVEAAPAPAAQQAASTSEADAVTELAAFLRLDLPHLFDEQGIDASRYDAAVEFVDPITKYSSLQGYLFNIALLRRLFAPEFILHDVRRSGEWELTTRWTMAMRFTISPVPALWSPTLTFTGTSVMGINPATKKFNRHIDTWDAVEDQQFFSTEAFRHMLSQLLDLKRPPALEGPAYTVLRKGAAYEVRHYEPYAVAEAPMGGAASPASPASPAGGAAAFGALAGFIFGGNDRGEKYAMTTPVFSDTCGRMRFVIGGGSAAALPAPTGRAAAGGVTTHAEPGGLYAAVAFSGFATEAEAEREAAALRAALRSDGLQIAEGGGWVLARYNDPSTPLPFRRNEVLVPLSAFELW
eukprot:scaffold14.g1320.t1